MLFNFIFKAISVLQLDASRFGHIPKKNEKKNVKNFVSEIMTRALRVR
jgi:hypothetical protein